MENNSVFYTIILAIRNVGNDLDISLNNFSNQTFKNFELIIADCNSNDNPAQFLDQREYPIHHIIQNDNGIYDAWNKVLPLVKGEWVVFMGAGDVFYQNDVLEIINKKLEKLSKDILIAYGEIDIIGENGEIIGASGIPWDKYFKTITKLNMFPHQATFQRFDSFKKYGYFDTNYKIAGDFEMILRIAINKNPIFIPLKISKFQLGGTSSIITNRVKMVIEWHKIMKAYKISHNYIIVLFKAKIIDLITYFLKNKKTNYIIDTYRILIGKKKRFKL